MLPKKRPAYCNILQQGYPRNSGWAVCKPADINTAINIYGNLLSHSRREAGGG